jgi:uncharacterized DUF497 family protein
MLSNNTLERTVKHRGRFVLAGEVIRIVSARPASASERKNYET